MSFTRLAAIARKEIIQIRRDFRSLIIVVMMPIVLVLLFGYGVNLDLKHLPIYVYDREGSRDSQDLLKRFQTSQYFHIVRAVNSYPDIVRAIDSGDRKSTRLNSSHVAISYAVFCSKKRKDLKSCRI